MGRFKAYVRDRQIGVVLSGLLFTFLVFLFAPSIFIVIKDGHAGVMYRPFFGGIVRDKVYGEGLHVLWPWNRLRIYDVRIQEVHRAVQVLDKTGLQYAVNVSIRYHPEYNALALLHQKVGPDYAEKIVVPEVEGVLRTAAGTMPAQDLYASEQGLLAKIVNDGLAKTDQKFIILDDLIIRSVELPGTIQQAIEKKCEEEQLMEAYVFRIKREQEEAKRKLIEAEGTKKANDVVSTSLNSNILKWKSIEATMALTISTNAKVVLLGNGPPTFQMTLGSEK